MKIIAKIYTDFKTKFGVPRQSGLAENEGTIIFEPEYRVDEALRGIEEFSHLWLIWNFSETETSEFKPTVRPPRLGGNKRVGVFATRSPFRPNPIGLSSVKLLAVEKTKEHGTILKVSGADLVNGTPIYDIKPYLAFTDSHPDAVGGFADLHLEDNLEVDFPDELLSLIPEEKRQTLISALRQDPRPHYKDDNNTYGLLYCDFDIKFSVSDKVLSVTDIKKFKKNS